jgi:hypothetical protein
MAESMLSITRLYKMGFVQMRIKGLDSLEADGGPQQSSRAALLRPWHPALKETTGVQEAQLGFAQA